MLRYFCDQTAQADRVQTVLATKAERKKDSTSEEEE
jgi:hypothetical protein